MKKEYNIENYNRDLYKYRQMCRIADRLTDVAMCGDKVNNEDEELIEFLKNKDKVRDLEIRLEENYRSDKFLRYIIASDKRSDTELLLSKMKLSRRRRRINLIKRVSSVAAIFVIAVVFLYVTLPHKSNNIIAINKISKNMVPTIILDNGEKIDLQGNEDLRLVSKDNISVIEKGKVKYETQAEAKNSGLKHNTIIVPSKFNYNIELADGTLVTLNANSSLRFPVAFAGEERRVELTGEAYFKVTKSAKPFIVVAGDCSIKVYGTEFNVNLNKRDFIEATLIEGSIGFKSASDKEVMLLPNQCVRMHRATNTIDVSNVDVQKYLGWKNGSFFYEQEKLGILLNEISNWYGVKIIVNNTYIVDAEISINIDRNIALNDLLKIMEKMFKVEFINDGDGKYILN